MTRSHLLVPVLLTLGLACARPAFQVSRTNPATLPPPRGYTHVVGVTGGRTLYVSGQIALDRGGALVGPGDLKAQTRQVFENLQAALATEGAGLDDIVKLTVFMTDASQVQTFREVRDAFLPRASPASSLVQVARLVRPDLLIEVEAIAVVPATPALRR